MKTSLMTLTRQLSAWQRWQSPLGGMLLARTPLGLAGIWFDGQKDHPGELAGQPAANDPLLLRTVAELAAYFDGAPARFTQPLDLHGTDFQRAVWQQLLNIAAGATCSYAEIARAVGSPAAVRAVGAAIGRNPVSVIVPCHRVIGSAGALTGYAGGLERKRALLQLESTTTTGTGMQQRLDEAA
ncbi:methylated-DNA--[protein]-cysteine S-methyltransferase [Piscinibacter sakaiensis]|uniref:methylated-DNA--[protein]-cysteine S-methyltransferase n=1 Tax=Piscinibacter sakaiensis TaxID=1547922 RepID=UPI003AAB2FDE